MSKSKPGWLHLVAHSTTATMSDLLSILALSGSIMPPIAVASVDPCSELSRMSDLNRREDGNLQLAVQVPGNTKADLSIPVAEGTTSVYVNNVPVAVQPAHGYAKVLAVGVGCQLVSIKRDGQAQSDEHLLGVCTTAPMMAEK